jgi:putative DNA primase/helicase
MSTANGVVTARSSLLSAALDYLGRGWSVLPLCTPDHAGMSARHCETCISLGKSPLVYWTQYQAELPTAAKIKLWWQRWPHANVGIALGPVSGLIRVDVEGKAGEAELRRRSESDLPDTLEFTSGKGRGLLYVIPAGVTLRTTTRPLAVSAELRLQGKGAQTVLPPSRHKSGKRYRWIEGHAPGEIEPSQAPGWIIDMMRADGAAKGKRRKRRAKSLADDERLTEGRRNDTLTSLAGSMRRPGMSEAAISAALKAENAARCSPPLPDSEVETIAASVARYEPAASCNGDGTPSLASPDGRTDAANGRRLIARHGANLRYCSPWSKWLVWDGTRWKVDDSCRAEALAKKVARRLWRDLGAVAASLGKEELRAIITFCKSSNSASGVSNMLTMARSEPRIPILPEQLDRDPWALNCANGTLDLRTGELREHRREDYFTNPDFSPSLWRQGP